MIYCIWEYLGTGGIRPVKMSAKAIVRVIITLEGNLESMIALDD